MAKQSTKTETETTTNNKPKEATEAVVAIAEQAIAFRDEKPTLSGILRVTTGAARMLRVKDRDQVANAAALLLGKRHLLGDAG
jgi:hypothetical protein